MGFDLARGALPSVQQILRALGGLLAEILRKITSILKRKLDHCHVLGLGLDGDYHSWFYLERTDIDFFPIDENVAMRNKLLGKEPFAQMREILIFDGLPSLPDKFF